MEERKKLYVTFNGPFLCFLNKGIHPAVGAPAGNAIAGSLQVMGHGSQDRNTAASGVNLGSFS